MGERTLSVYITAERGNIAEVIISDDESGCSKTFYVGGYCTDDEKAKEMGYEIISWAEDAIKEVMEE